MQNKNREESAPILQEKGAETATDINAVPVYNGFDVPDSFPGDFPGKKAPELRRRHVHFITWLYQQAERNDPIGDLATDAKCDGKDFNVRSYKQLKERMDELNACDAAFKALDKAFQEFHEGK